jgi:enoyl-CoA hydratase/carnithine racemase
MKNLRVEKDHHIAEVILCRPNKLNAMDQNFFDEVLQTFNTLSIDDDVNVIILWAEGKAFSAGLDLRSAASLLLDGNDTESASVQNLRLLKAIQHWQASNTAIAKCKKPVIAAIQGHCIGGAIDMITACDIRLATEDSLFSVRETKIAIVADLGTLQRLQPIVGKGFAREMAFTGNDYDAKTCKEHALVNAVYKTHEECLKAARLMAKNIATNSPLVVQGTKQVLNYAEDHNTEDSLTHVALWNAALLKSEDLQEAIMSYMEKRTPKFINRL